MSSLLARAKVNLSLHVTGRRDDGYHELCSLVVFPEFGDQIALSAGQALDVRFSGPFSDRVSPLNNSVISAVRWFESQYDLRVDLGLLIQKLIPVEAGLGGGTADCAAVVHALCEYYDRHKPKAEDLLGLGADVPVSFYGDSCIMEGLGERITPARLDQDYGVVLVNPRINISTAKAFKNLKKFDQPFEKKDIYSLDQVKEMHNSLEQPAMALCPEIGELKQYIERLGSLLVRMSGSGATVFALTALGEETELAVQISERFPQYWVNSTQLKRSTT